MIENQSSHLWNLSDLETSSLKPHFKAAISSNSNNMATSEEFKHHVVQLDGHLDIPELRFPHTFTKHVHTTPPDLPSRLENATLVIATTTRIDRLALSHAPNLQLISSLGAGTDKIDSAAAKAAGVTVTNVPAQNTGTVAEHALGLYFAVKRKIVELDAFVRDGEKWARQGMSVVEFRGLMPRVCEEETVGIIGYGALGEFFSHQNLS